MDKVTIPPLRFDCGSKDYWITPPSGTCKTDEDCIDQDSQEIFCCAKDAFSGEGKKKKYCMPTKLNGLKLKDSSNKAHKFKCKSKKVQLGCSKKKPCEEGYCCATVSGTYEENDS